MNIQEVKNIRIADYLQSLGYTPVKQQGNSLWYKSPLREEKDASFKVNTELNKWYDFGLGKGGNIIALAEELYATDYVPYLLNKIAERVPHIRPVSFSFRQQASEPSFQHLEVGELTHPALLRYLQERGVNTDWQGWNVRSCTSSITANLISPSASRMWQEGMKCATVSSRAASHRKTSAIFVSREDRERNVSCSRV